MENQILTKKEFGRRYNEGFRNALTSLFHAAFITLFGLCLGWVTFRSNKIDWLDYALLIPSIPVVGFLWLVVLIKFRNLRTYLFNWQISKMLQALPAQGMGGSNSEMIEWLRNTLQTAKNNLDAASALSRKHPTRFWVVFHENRAAQAALNVGIAEGFISFNDIIWRHARFFLRNTILWTASLCVIGFCAGSIVGTDFRRLESQKLWTLASAYIWALLLGNLARSLANRMIAEAKMLASAISKSAYKPNARTYRNRLEMASEKYNHFASRLESTQGFHWGDPRIFLAALLLIGGLPGGLNIMRKINRLLIPVRIVEEN